MNPQDLRERARRFRAMAMDSTDQRAIKALIEMATELEQAADAAAPRRDPEPSPDGVK